MATIDGVAAFVIVEARQLLLQELVGACGPSHVLVAVLALVLESLIQVAELKLALVAGDGACSIYLGQPLIEHSEMLNIAAVARIRSSCLLLARPPLSLHRLRAQIGIAEVPECRIATLPVGAVRLVILSRVNHVFAAAWIRDGRLAHLRLLASGLIRVPSVRF